MPDTPNLPPDDLGDAVDEEVAEQAAVDRSDAAPADKVAARDAARAALERRTDVEPDPGPNPS